MWRFRALKRVVLDVSNWLLPLAAINLIWCLLSLTIILLPPATAALFDVADQARQGHGPSVQYYLGSAKRWLVRAWAWGVGCAAAILISGVALSFYGAQHSFAGTLFLFICAAVAAFVAGVQFYFWPYLLVQDAPLMRRALRNAAFTLLADPLQALLYGGLALALLVFGAALIVPMVLISPVVTAFLAVYSLREWLEHHGVGAAETDGAADGAPEKV
jgi:uncharacterized membrane protein YesL